MYTSPGFRFDTTPPRLLQFHSTVQSGNAKKVKKFIQTYVAQININSVSDDGSTVMHIACRRGDLDVVKLVGGAGANLHLQDKVSRGNRRESRRDSGAEESKSEAARDSPSRVPPSVPVSRSSLKAPTNRASRHHAPARQ